MKYLSNLLESTRINPPIPISTPKGEGIAHVLIDYGIDFDLIWVAFINSTGECWSFPNQKIRAINNITIGRECKKE
jgi:hypothetical protein